MTTPVLCLGKLLCITLFAIPSSPAYQLGPYRQDHPYKGPGSDWKELVQKTDIDGLRELD